MTTCPKCRRPVHLGPMSGLAEGRCTIVNGPVCRAVAEAYRRGLHAGVELARDYADIACPAYEQVNGWIDWSAVDEELAKRIDR